MGANWGFAAVIIYSVLSLAPAKSEPGVPVIVGEVPLEIVATVSSYMPAQYAELSICVTARARTTPEADTAVKNLADKVRDSLAAQGIARTDIVGRQFGGAGRFGFVGNESLDLGDVSPEIARLQSANADKIAVLYIDVTVRDLKKLDAVRRYLVGANVALASGPTLKIVDENIARRVAIADAVANAQLEANDYAAALHMRVSRIVRIKNSAPLDAAFNANMLQRMTSGNLLAPADNKVATDVRATVEFVLSK